MKLMPLMACLLLFSAIGVQANEPDGAAAGAFGAEVSRDGLGDIFMAKPNPSLEQLLAYPRAGAAGSPRAVPECSRYHSQAACEATNWCIWDGSECTDGIGPAAMSAQ